MVPQENMAPIGIPKEELTWKVLTKLVFDIEGHSLPCQNLNCKNAQTGPLNKNSDDINGLSH